MLNNHHHHLVPELSKSSQTETLHLCMLISPPPSPGPSPHISPPPARLMVTYQQARIQGFPTIGLLVDLGHRDNSFEKSRAKRIFCYKYPDWSGQTASIPCPVIANRLDTAHHGATWRRIRSGQASPSAFLRHKIDQKVPNSPCLWLGKPVRS